MGQLTLMTEFFTLANNELSSEVPSELAGLKSISNGFSLENNDFCGDLPDELSDLEDQVTSAGGYSAGAMGGVLVAGLVVGLVAGLFAGRRQKVATQKVASAAGMYGGVEEKEPLTHAL